MKVLKVTYNWFPPTSEGYRDEFEQAEVGISNVFRIEEHLPQGEGDKCYYDIFFADGTMKRIFNPNAVTFKN